MWAIIVLLVLLLIAMVIYPWLAIAVLLVAPVLKVAAVYYLPMFRVADPTLVACALAGVMALWTYVRRVPGSPMLHVPWPQLLCMTVIALVLILSLLWTTAPDYGARKAFRFAGIGIPYLLLPMFFVRSRKDGHRMLRMIVLVGLLVSLGMIMMPQSQLSSIRHGHGYGRGTFLGSDAIMPAVIIGLGMLVLSTMFAVPGSAPRWLRYLALLVFPFGLLAILLTGARSTLVGLALAATPLLFLAGRRGRFRAIFIVFVLLPVGTFLLLTISAVSGMITTGRWSELFHTSIMDNMATRLPHFKFCLTEWVTQPILGHGSGSFAVDLFRVDTPMYPHNILLEALYETGLTGFIALSLFLYWTLRQGLRGLRLATTPADRVLVVGPMVAVVFMLIQGLSHWDLDGGRALYLFSGLLYACVYQVRSEAADDYGHLSGYPSRKGYLGSAWADYGGPASEEQFGEGGRGRQEGEHQRGV